MYVNVFLYLYISLSSLIYVELPINRFACLFFLTLFFSNFDFDFPVSLFGICFQIMYDDGYVRKNNPMLDTECSYSFDCIT